MLAAALGPDTLLLREPGGTELGERIRELLKDATVEINPGAELLLFCAARAELAARVIAPARENGRDIVCDRYIDSTSAYQGAAIGELYVGSPDHPGSPLEIGIGLVEQLNALIVAHCVPDVTVLVRVDPEQAQLRGQQRLAAGASDGSDRFERRGIEFQRGVADAYEELATRHPERIAVVDGSGSPRAVHERVLEVVRERQRELSVDTG
jgi:dTMP kinase